MASIQPRRLASGEVAWRVMGRHDGKQQQKSFTTQEKAEAFKRNAERLGWAAAEQIEERRQGKEAVTLRQWAEKYLDPNSGILTGIEQATRDEYRAQAQGFLARMGDLPIDSITRDDVGAWITWQLEQTYRRHPNSAPKKYAASTVKNFQHVLSSMLKAAVERDLIHKNPAAKARIKDNEPSAGVFLTVEQFWAFHNAMTPHYRPFLRYLLASQGRFHELAALTWRNVSQVRLQDGSWATAIRITENVQSAGVGKGKKIGAPKTKKSRRTITLWPGALSDVESGKPDDYVFLSTMGKRMSHSGFMRHWNNAVNAAGLEGLHPTPHDLRHTGTSLLIAAGKSLAEIQDRLGHESIETTRRVYGHLEADADSRLGAVFGAILTAPKVIERKGQ